jgi:hypothetical protein
MFAKFYVSYLQGIFKNSISKQMKILTTLLLILLPTICFSQILFEKGYFLDLENKRFDCLIKNSDWSDNPNSFTYKLKENSREIKGSLDSVTEFGVEDQFKFVKRTFELDISSNKKTELSQDSQPEFQTTTAFLKVVIEGQATLYTYKIGSNKTFFYSIQNQNPKQLIHKEFIASNDVISENNEFREQIRVELSTPMLNKEAIRKIRYNENDLKEVTINYNKSKSSESKIIKSISKKNGFQIGLTVGSGFSSFKYMDRVYFKDWVNFETKPSFNIGLLFNYILPFKKDKLSVFVNPTFQSLSRKISNQGYNLKVNYSYIHFPFGFQNSFFLKNKDKLFLKLLAAPGLGINFNKYLYVNDRKYVEFMPTVYFGAGFGYEKNKLSVEFRTHSNDDILLNYPDSQSKYFKTNLIFSYRLK